MKVRISHVLALIPVLLFSACGNKRKSQGMMDDPRAHSDQGKKYFDQGNLGLARDEFKKALELDKKFAPGLAGMSLVEAASGKFDKALDLADEAIVRGKKQPDGWMAKGVAISYKNRGSKDDDWIDDMEKCFSNALDIDGKNGEVWYRLGLGRQWALQFGKAGEAFRKVLDLDGTYTGLANDAWAKVQKIERAAPGTRVGKKIALVDSITRADAAALFIAELGVDRILGRVRGNADTGFKAAGSEVAAAKGPAASDIAGYWAENFINDVLKLGIRGLQVNPDGTFLPKLALTRAEYAFLVEDVLIGVLGDKTLATRHIGAAARFSDVASGSPYFNAICNAVDKNVMDANADGSFGALKPVSGADALLTIRLIKELRK